MQAPQDKAKEKDSGPFPAAANSGSVPPPISLSKGRGLVIRLFGRCCITRDGEPIPDLHLGKVQELLWYLLLHRGRDHSREALASLYWSNSSTAQSRQYLRTALWHLRSALKEPPDGGLLLVGADSARINPIADFCLDVAEFESIFSVIETLSGQPLNQEGLTLLQRATELYCGDLLEGCYEDWCLYERERLQNMYLIMLDKLLSACEAHGDCERGRSYGARILRYDPASEVTHQRLMRLYYGAGDRAGALRQYDRCVAALKDALAVQPSRQTLELYAEIRADDHDFSPSSKPSEASGDAGPSLHELHSRLRKMRSVLSSLQLEIQRDIRSLDQVLNGGSRSRGTKPDKRSLA